MTILEQAAPLPNIIAGRSVVHRACPQCAADNAAEPPNRYSDGGWLLKDCRQCGFVYLEDAPVYEELYEEFAWEKTSVARNKTRKDKHPLLYALSKKTRWRLHLFKRKQMENLLVQYAAGGNVLDVGCGKGGQLKKLSPAFVPHGIEISRAEAAHASEYARQRGGTVIVKPAVEGLQAFEENFAAAVFMRSYLEHEANPKAVLRGVFRVLSPGGVVIIKVPNYSSWNRGVYGKWWCGFRFPDHLNYFTTGSLKRMCEDCGLTVVRFGLFDHLPISDNMWLVGEKPK
jgi:SAM-dependent methyltransferase